MDFGEIMKQTQAMQGKMQQIHDELANMKVGGQAGGGLVKVIMTGRHDIVNLFIDDQIIQDAAKGPEGKKVLQELLAATINDAVQRIEEATKNKMAGMAQDFKLPEEFMGGEGNANPDAGSAG